MVKYHIPLNQLKTENRFFDNKPPFIVPGHIFKIKVLIPTYSKHVELKFAGS